MPETVQITIAAETSDAAASLQVFSAQLGDLRAPLIALGTASVQAAQIQQIAVQGMVDQALQATRAMQQADAAYVEAFKNGMQVLVDSKQLSLQQALGYDVDYSSQVFAQEQDRLEAIRDNDAASVDDRKRATQMMQEADARYTEHASEQYRQLSDNARRQADRVAQSYEEAFDRVGGSVQHTFNDILTRQTTWAKGMNRIAEEVDTFFLEQVQDMAAKWAASGLANIAGGAVSSAVGAAQTTGASGLGAGLTALLGIGQPGGLFGSGLLSGAGAASATTQAAAITANTTALGASTTAMTALTTALTGTTAADTAGSGASLAGGAATAGAAAGGGGLFSWLGGLFSFGGGGIVPSAAGGWAVPNLAGATPALLHAREMVLPADISQGLQGMIAAGGGGEAHFHAHFHGPSDAPSVNRWFRENLKSNANALRDLFRQNALTPRSF